MLSKNMSLVFYVVVFIISLILYYNRDSINIRYKTLNLKPTLILFYLLFIIVFGFRYGVGTDYYNYQYLIQNLIFNYTEPINGLIYLIGNITNYEQISFSIYVMLTLLLIVKAIDINFNDKRSQLYAMMFYLFIYFPHALNTVRESLAIAFMILSFSLLVCKKDIKYSLVLYLCALLTHNMVIIIAPVYLFYILNIRKIFIILFYILFFMIVLLLAVCNSNIPLLSRITVYLEISNIDFGIGLFVIKIPLFIFITLIYFFIEDDKRIRYYSIISLSGVVLRHLSYVSFYFYRFANPFNIFNCFLVGYIPILQSNIINFLNKEISYKNKDYFNKIMKFLNSEIFATISLLTIVIIYFIYEFYIGTTGEIMNYQLLFRR